MFKKENYLMMVLVIGFGVFNTSLIAQDESEEDVEPDAETVGELDYEEETEEEE